MNLDQKKCVPCQVGAPTLSPDQTKEYLNSLSEPWEILDKKKIQREFKFKDFKEALDFINMVGEVAEEEGHHPDIHNYYSKVVMELWTHKIGGLHENDFVMAEKINKLYAN